MQLAGLLTRPCPNAFPYRNDTVAMIVRVFERTHSSGYCQRFTRCSLLIFSLKKNLLRCKYKNCGPLKEFIFLCTEFMDNSEKKELIEYLSTFISDRRKTRLDEVLAQRTGHLRIVLENVYQAHNASAVMRSCDCFGIQYVHYIENRNRLKISDDVAMGSSNWLTIQRHSEKENNTVDALLHLKSLGYKIVATTPHKNDHTIDELPVDQKIALVFGTEIDGISQDVFDLADEFVRVPMYGFTESFNVSVCAALCMYELTTRIRKTVPAYALTEQEQLDVYFEWLRTSVEYGDKLIADYLSKKQSENK
jgi:tRNA (guanosine-2'-O-)-methyltransferase